MILHLKEGKGIEFATSLVAALGCLVPCRQMYTLDRYIILRTRFRQCQIAERTFIIDFQRFQFSEAAYSALHVTMREILWRQMENICFPICWQIRKTSREITLLGVEVPGYCLKQLFE